MARLARYKAHKTRMTTTSGTFIVDCNGRAHETYLTLVQKDQQYRVLSEKHPLVEEPTPLSRATTNQHGEPAVYAHDCPDSGSTPHRCEQTVHQLAAGGVDHEITMTVTRHDQNEVDAKAQHRDELVGSWMDRLQHISIIVSS